MKNMTIIANNKILYDMTIQAIRSALILKARAISDRQTEEGKRDTDEPYDFTSANAYDQGVHEICAVLTSIYGGYPFEAINAISIIIRSQKENTKIGYDSLDYIEMFEDALERARKDAKS